MKKRDNANPNTAWLDELIEEITVDAKGNDEQLWAFRQAFENTLDPGTRVRVKRVNPPNPPPTFALIELSCCWLATVSY
jgi:hypothetical protein